MSGRRAQTAHVDAWFVSQPSAPVYASQPVFVQSVVVAATQTARPASNLCC